MVICVAMFISAMDMTIVNVALPDMSNDLDAGIGELQWVLDAFLVALAGLLPVGSGLADRFGRRRVFLSGFAGFAVELRRAHPLFDVRVLVRPRVAVGAFAIFAAYIASLGMLFLLPQHVQYVQDGSALASGLELASFGVGLGALAPVGGRLVGRYGPRVVLLAGLLTATAGFVPLLLLSGDSSPALLVLGTGIVGCGLGLTVPPATAVIMNDLGLEKAGDGAAVNQLARQVGGALGVAIVGSVFAAIYAAEVADDGVPAAAKESIEDTTDIASRLHGAARVDLLHDAVTSFDVAARWGLAVCMAAVLLSAASAAIGLTGVTRAKR